MVDEPDSIGQSGEAASFGECEEVRFELRGSLGREQCRRVLERRTESIGPWRDLEAQLERSSVDG